MKNQFLLIVFLLLLGADKLFSQSFSYSPIGESFVRVMPTFEERHTKGKQEFLLSLPQDCYLEMLKQIHAKCLNAAQIEMLKNRGLIVQMYINNKGEVFYANFWIRKELQNRISEQELLSIYRAFREMQLDFNKGYSVPSMETLTDNYFAKIMIPLIPRYQ